MNKGTIGTPFLLFLIFMILKLVGSIEWSWWWVSAPLWIAASFWLSIVLPLTVLNERRKVKEMLRRSKQPLR